MIAKADDSVFLDSAAVIVETSPIPLYYQLIRLIEGKIRANEWRPGCSLPSEQAFCDHFGLSRTVIRQAFADLQNRGLLLKRNGKRTTIAHPSYRGSLMQYLTGFHEEAERRGEAPRTKVMEMKVIPAPQVVAEKLNLPPDRKVILLSRLRSLGEEPQVYVKTYLRFELCSSLLSEDLTDQSLYRILREKLGLDLVKATRTIRAATLNAREARLLGVEAGSAALLLASVGFLADGTPLEYFVSKHRGDTSEFEVQLVR
jgi:DNA-binding GntR family transcriptional regulator